MTSEQLCVYRRLNKLLLRKATGTPAALAQQIGIHRSTVFRYLDELRNLGAEITYYSGEQTYCYENDFNLQRFFS